MRQIVGFVMGAAFALALFWASMAYAQSTTWQLVMRTGDMTMWWYQDSEARCYVVTNEAGSPGINNGVARGVAIACNWSGRP